MRKIIECVEYNTRTAYKVAKATAQPDIEDSKYWEEELYRDIAGRYFIVGFGGPYTHWGRPVGPSGLGGGFGLRALSDKEANEWKEDRGSDPEVIYDKLE